MKNDPMVMAAAAANLKNQNLQRDKQSEPISALMKSQNKKQNIFSFQLLQCEGLLHFANRVSFDAGMTEKDA